MNVRFQALGVAIVAFFVGCAEEERPLGPSTVEFNQQRQGLVAKLQKEKGAGKPAQAARQANAADAGGATSFAPSSVDFNYDPAGRRDPFRSYAWEHMKRDLAESGQSGPLEHFDLSQLELVGVVWNVGRARGLVEDPSGMSYVVAAGARMGKNEGLVTRIDDNLMVVRERYVDLYGNESMKDIELRIRASDGG